MGTVNSLNKAFTPNSTIAMDIGNLCGSNVRYFTLEINCASYASKLDDAALGIERTEGTKATAAVKGIVGKRDVLMMIPEVCEIGDFRGLKSFEVIRNYARNAIGKFATPNPLLPTGVFALCTRKGSNGKSNLDKANDCQQEAFEAFNATKEAFIEALPSIRAEMLGRFESAAIEVYNERKSRLPVDMTYAEFHARYIRAFDKRFPSPESIRKDFRFSWRAIGHIPMPVDFIHKGTVEANAVMDVINASQAEFNAMAKSYVGQMFAGAKVKLFEALYPAVEAIRRGDSFGKREIGKVLTHLEKIAMYDIFGDVTITGAMAKLEKAYAGLDDKVSKAQAIKAAEGTKEAMAEVCASLEGLAFNPADYARLELDGDDSVSVIADADVREMISEEMAKHLADSLATLADAAKTAEEKVDAQKRLNFLVGIKDDKDADKASIAFNASQIEV